MSKLNGLELAFRGLSDEEKEDGAEEIGDVDMDEGFGEEEDDGSNSEV